MDHKNPNFIGLTKVIFNALLTAAPELIVNSRIIDHRLLQRLDEILRRQWVTRADGTNRLVIELVLTRALSEIRQALARQERGWESIGPLRHDSHDPAKYHDAVG